MGEVVGIGVEMVAFGEVAALCGLDVAGGSASADASGAAGSSSDGLGFEARAFTPAELAEAELRGNRVQYLAGRLAVKRAVLKALAGRVDGGVDLRVIETLADRLGAPRVTVGEALAPLLAQAGAHELLVSITNDCGLALAFVIAQ